MPARIEHGGYTDTPGLSPAISRCVYGPLQDVSEYSRFLHGGATKKHLTRRVAGSATVAPDV